MTIPAAEHARRGHPDIFANRIAETIVYHALLAYPLSRVDVAASIGYDGKDDVVTINGNATTDADIGEETIRRLVYEIANDLGYSARRGFDPENFALNSNISLQSPEIAPHASNGVAADSRPCYGYASNETPFYLPRSVVDAKRISDKIDAVFRSGAPVGPDGKVQVEVTYTDGLPQLSRVSVHAQSGTGDTKDYLFGLLGQDINGAELNLLLFQNGGTRIDKGHSGTKSWRYGEALPNGGGNFFGLDPSKTERYGTVIARHMAKSIVASGLSDRCKVHIAYRMGSDKPSVYIETPCTPIDLTKISGKFPLSPKEAIEEYNLRDPAIIKGVMENGFPGNPEMPWEKAVKL